MLGQVARPWKLVPASTAPPVTPVAFASFDDPGRAKIVFSLRVDPYGTASSLLTMETRVALTDPDSRRRFRRYWFTPSALPLGRFAVAHCVGTRGRSGALFAACETEGVTEVDAQGKPPESLLEAIGNLARFHREHEKFYSQAPLRQAQVVQAASRALKALAGQWSDVEPSKRPSANPFAGAEDLNAPGLVAESGILFMEGEGEPAEIKRIKRDFEAMAADSEQTGAWLSRAMEQAWETAGVLASYPALADLLGERHRIIANDWQSAGLLALVARLLRRALDLLDRVDFSPEALRTDLTGGRQNPSYLYSASELLDRAADLMAESATLVHENERRWRVFGDRVRGLQAEAG